MRRGGMAARLGATELDHDDGLFAFGGKPRHLEQTSTVGNMLREHHDYVGRRVVDHELNKIEDVEVGGIAATHFVTDTYSRFLRAPHHVDLARAAALRDNADIA